MQNKTRLEKDTLGEVEVSSDKYWGAQTQRSLQNFVIGNEKMPLRLIKALAIVKYCCVSVNKQMGLIEGKKSDVIMEVAEEIINGHLDSHFPLAVWQTGSGTQTNMNVNEVISNRAIEKLGGVMGSKTPIHPNDDVNMGQSSNDSIPSAMNIATVLSTRELLLPSLDKLCKVLKDKSLEFSKIIKIGRTHLQDATPLTLGQEFSGYYAQIDRARGFIHNSLNSLYYLAQGATAVGTGLNSSRAFADKFAGAVNMYTKELSFKSAFNKFAAIASHDDLVEYSGSMNTLAVALTKIVNDIRFLSSGPRAGIAEISITANEPGSSIMPGKINPTQIEAVTMVCAQVMANHFAVSLGGMSGQLELNAYKPLIIYNILSSIDLLSSCINSLVDKCLIGLTANNDTIKAHMERSLMLVTALNSHIGYDNSAKIAKYAYINNMSLKEAANKLNILDEHDFDRLVDPKKMI